MADPSCRKNKTTVPCKKGDRSNVNTHHKSKHRLRGVAGAVKAGLQKTSEREHPAELRGEQEFLCWNEQVCVCQIASSNLFSNTYQTGLGKGTLKYVT